MPRRMKGLRFAAGALGLLLLGWLALPRAREAAPADPAASRAGHAREARDPAAELAAPSAVTTAARTTIAVLRVGDGGERVELVSWVTKPIPFALADDSSATAARYVLEDARTGARLASGPCPLPRPCACGDPGGRHGHGCVRRKHERVVRLKLPRLAPSERLTIVGPDGELARFELEGA